MTRADGPIRAFDEPAISALDRTPSSIHSQAIDPTALAEAAVASVLSLVCVNPHARRRLGLTAASRRADGWPAWYLWLAGTPGAYELALVPPAATSDWPPAGADFALRYFPHPDEEDYAGFAAIEQQARCSPLFDHTGTPAIETLGELDPSLFHIAMLSLSPSPADGGLDLTLEAQDAWLETIETQNGPQTRRAVAGLALAAPIVDFLVCARTYCGRHPPAALAMTREPGIAWHVDSNGIGRPSPSPDASLFRLHVGGLPALGVPASLCARGDGEAEPARAAQTMVCRHEGTDAPPRFAPFATDDWWKAATWRFYPVGAMCGCQVDDETVVGRDDPSGARQRRSVNR